MRWHNPGPVRRPPGFIEPCLPTNGHAVPTRAALGRKGSRQAFLYAFDLLELDGQDLQREPWETRRTILISLLRKATEGIRLSEHIEGTDGTTIFGHACRMGLEGIVAKRRDRLYRSGRSPDWVKIKNPDAPGGR